MYLIDTPGIIAPIEKLGGGKFSVKHSQIGAITWDKTKNPDLVISTIMKEYPDLLEKHYDINANGDSEIFIEELGKKLSYLRKGNLVDEDRTAKKVLRDWQSGEIKLF